MRTTLKQFLWTAYDHLGLLVGCNVVWSVLALPWIGGAYSILHLGFTVGGLLMPIAVALSGVLIFGAPGTAMLFAAGAAWARGREFGMRDFLQSGRFFFWRALALGLVLDGGSTLAMVNLVFYQRIGGWIGSILSGMMLWFALLFGMVAVYVFPVLVTQGGGVWSSLRQSFLLAIDNIKLSLLLLLTAGLALGIGFVSGLGLFCGVAAAWALFVSVAFRALLPKYTGEPLPEEQPRRLRELIRPWEV